MESENDERRSEERREGCMKEAYLSVCGREAIESNHGTIYGDEEHRYSDG